MPDVGKTQRTYESLGLAARAESEMQPPVELRAAQPLETIVDPLWRHGAEELTRARRRKTLDEEIPAACIDRRIFFMCPLHCSQIRWFC
jgi:hypothetical protein